VQISNYAIPTRQVERVDSKSLPEFRTKVEQELADMAKHASGGARPRAGSKPARPSNTAAVLISRADVAAIYERRKAPSAPAQSPNPNRSNDQ
jgi:hypothetical protein